MNKETKERILDYSKGLVLSAIFSEFQQIFGSVYDNPDIKESFLSFLIELINDGELKLASGGKFLEGTSEEQVDVLRQAWPSEYDPDVIEKDIDSLWWIIKAPAGAVWIYPDGYEEWT